MQCRRATQHPPRWGSSGNEGGDLLLEGGQTTGPLGSILAGPARATAEFLDTTGLVLRRGMYLETVASETSMPSFSSSPWIFGAPHCGFAELISRMRSRTSRAIRGRPGPGLLFFLQ